MSELSIKFKDLANEQVRENIKRIVMSYRNTWDIYSELFQNSIDAIIDEFGFENIDKGVISLKVNTIKREIIITDNGIGIDSKSIPNVLVLGESLKRKNNTGRFGFMGFGFTFIAFQSEYLKIESIHDGLSGSRTYTDLYKYVFLSDELPNSEEENLNILPLPSTNNNGTTITLRFPKNFPNETIENTLNSAFEIVSNSILFEYILKTKTSIGIVDNLFESKNLFTLNINVNNTPLDIKPGYMSNKEIIQLLYNPIHTYTLENFKQFIEHTEHLTADAKKTARKTTLIDTVVNNVTIGSTNPLTVRFYISATSKSHLNEYTKKLNYMCNPDEMEVTNGLWLSINSLPTGICLDSFDHPSYLPFTIIADVLTNDLRNELDSGRKGITQYRANQIVLKSKELLQSLGFISYREYVISASSRIVHPLTSPRDELQNKLNSKTLYDIPIKNHYLPPLSEQEVIGIFMELICTNKLLGYIPKVISSYDVYDSLCNYTCDFNNEFISTSNLLALSPILKNQYSTIDKSIVIEFKTKLSQIFGDVRAIKKDLKDIDIIVCWDAEYNKASEFVATHGVVLKEVDKTTNIFYGVTHEMVGLGQNNQYTPIIELKTVLNTLLNINL